MQMLRSLALVPAHQTALVETALSWGAAGVLLDLHTLVHPQRRAEARRQTAQCLRRPSAGATLLVRLPAEASAADWEAVHGGGLAGVVLAEVEERGQVASASARLQEVERALGIAPQSLGLFLSLDTGRSLWEMATLVEASPRVQGVILGLGDAAFDLTDVPEPLPFYRLPIPRFTSPLFVYSRTAYLAAALGVQRLVHLGTSIAPRSADSALLRQGVWRAAALGFTGAVTPHREGVEACHAHFLHR